MNKNQGFALPCSSREILFTFVTGAGTEPSKFQFRGLSEPNLLFNEIQSTLEHGRFVHLVFSFPAVHFVNAGRI